MTESDFTASAVENLVTQFSSALDFYRELVQNSIDAGSAAIDIWLDFIPDEGGGSEGVIEIHVDDGGEGMSEAIIDDQLTTLFSSSKENDLTKIGKFGIGFVSVFALRPRAVLVHTGRDGEYWEVFFDQDRSFFKSRLETPVEGTQITLFVAGDRARYTELVRASIETIDHWCRHSEAEISFEDRASQGGVRVQINQPFAVDGLCPTRFEREGTQIVLAFASEPVWGFYNKGLALAVVRGKTDLVPPRLAHVGFRIKSRYLEHTLSRETVMRDANYDKAMALIEEAADGPLRLALAQELVGLTTVVAGGDKQPGRRWTMAERGRYFELMDFLAREGQAAAEALLDQPLLLSLDGRALTLAQIREQAAGDGRVFTDDQRSPLVEHLLAQGTPVILTASQDDAGALDAHRFDPVARVLANGLAGSFAAGGKLQRVIDMLRGDAEESAWSRASRLLTRPAAALVGVETVDEPAARRLVALAESISLRALGPGSGPLQRVFAKVSGRPPRIGYRRLVPARLHGTGTGGALGGARRPLFVIAHAIAPLMALPTDELMISALDGQPEAAVNCDHPHFRVLLGLAEQAPAMAGYCLAKSLLLQVDRDLELDLALMGAALEGSL